MICPCGDDADASTLQYCESILYTSLNVSTVHLSEGVIDNDAVSGAPCVTFTTTEPPAPLIVTLPVRADVPVFAATLSISVPLPDPDGDTNDIHDASDEAVQGHPLVTAT